MFRDRYFAWDMLDADVLVLQACVVVCGGAPVLAMLLSAGLGDAWALGVMALVAHDRMGCGPELGAADVRAKVRRCVVHALAAGGALPFSEVERQALHPGWFAGDADVAAALREVAEFAPGGVEGGSGTYRLRASAWAEVRTGGLWARWDAAAEERTLAHWRRATRAGEGAFPAPAAPDAVAPVFAPLVLRVVEAAKPCAVGAIAGAASAEGAFAALLLFHAAACTGRWREPEDAALLEGAAARLGGAAACVAEAALRAMGRASSATATAAATAGASEASRRAAAAQRRILREHERARNAFAALAGGGGGGGDDGDDMAMADAPGAKGERCCICAADGADALIAAVLPASTLRAEEALALHGPVRISPEAASRFGADAAHAAVRSIRREAGEDDARDGVVHACGHCAHSRCLEAYVASQARTLSGLRDPTVNPRAGELLCPECRRFSNLPLGMPLVAWPSNGAGGAGVSDGDGEADRRFWAALRLPPVQALAAQLSVMYVASRGNGRCWQGATASVALRRLACLVLAGHGPASLPPPPHRRAALSRDALEELLERVRAQRPQSRVEAAAAVRREARVLAAWARAQDELCGELGAAVDDGEAAGNEAVLAAMQQRAWPAAHESARAGCGLLAYASRMHAEDALNARVALLLADGLGDGDDDDAAAVDAAPSAAEAVRALKDEWRSAVAACRVRCRTGDAQRLLHTALFLPRALASADRPHRLASLPADFSALLLPLVAKRAQCAACMRVPASPALCLLCGRLVCGDEDACCRGLDGACEAVAHAATCARGGNGQGCVLLLRKSARIALVLDSTRTCTWAALYLDEHGEEDADRSRGLPLYLDGQRFERLDREIAAAGALMDTRVLARMASGVL